MCSTNCVLLYRNGLAYRYLSPERARLGHPWHLKAPTASCYCLPARAFFPLFLFCFVCVCVYPKHGTAGEPGAIAGGRGRWPVDGGSEGARSPFWCGVACPSRREGSMNGLCLAPYLWGWIYYAPVRVYKGHFGVRKNIQAVLVFATELNFTERAPQSEHQHCRVGERRPR